ncbi:hypothetical protein JCM10213_006838 [Rhodosporidiobolus nylandii]
MAPPVLLAASRAAARSHTAGGALLDVLAPAVYAAQPSQRCHQSSHAPRPAATSSSSSAPSPSAGPPSSSARRKTYAAPIPAAEKRRPQPKKRNPRPPALPASPPSAVDLLSRIRKVAPSPAGSSPEQTAQAVDSHNLAVLALNRGVSQKNYQHAFQQGWLSLRRRGQAGRLPPMDVAKILSVATATAKEDPERIRVDWKKLKELVLWLCGEGQDVQTLVGEWAWETISLGEEGCQRVVEIFEALRRDEHSKLREDAKAPDFATKDARPFTESNWRTARMSSRLFAAGVAAQTLLRAKQPSPEPFSALLPAYLDRSLPKLETFLRHSKSDAFIKRHLHPKAVSALAKDAVPLVLSHLRQVALAQRWYADPSMPVIGVWRLVSRHFRKGEYEQAWELWQALQEAVDGPEVSWLSMEKWDASAKERWLSKELRDEIERDERRAFEEEEGELDAEVDIRSPASSSPSSPATLPPALLHQALVAKFLSGFAYSRQFEHAEAIWTWLSTHSPPLTPGVVCWNGLLNGYARRGDVIATEQVFSDMRDARVEPDLWSWVERIVAHFEAKVPDEALGLVRVMQRDPRVQHYVDREFGGSLPEGAYNAIIVGLLQNGRRVEAESFLDEMEKKGAPPSTYTINGFLKHYVRGNKPDLAALGRLMQLITARGLEANVYTFTMILVALLQSGQKDATSKTIAIMEASNVKPSVATYGAIIAHLAKTGKHDELTAAVQLLDEMESKRLATNQIIYTSLIQGFLRGVEVTPAATAQDPFSASLGASSSSASPSPAHAAPSAPPATADSPSPQPPTPAGPSRPLSEAARRRAAPAPSPSPSAIPPVAAPPPIEPTVHPYFVAALTLKDRMQRRGLALNRVGYNALLGAALDLQTEEGVGLALNIYSEMQKRLRRTTGGEADEAAAEQDAKGRQVTVADTWFVLLSGFARNHDWRRAHALVLEMEKAKFEIRNKGLQKLVRYVTRRDYQYIGKTEF